jgi:hypothetical protein
MNRQDAKSAKKRALRRERQEEMTVRAGLSGGKL